MKTWLVGIVLVVGAGSAPDANAQGLRIGTTLRVADHVVVRFSYGNPYVLYDPYASYRHRHHKVHRKLAREHRRYHRALRREHRQLHHDLFHGHIGRREHRRWHDAVGFDHDAFHDELDDHHDRTHRRRGRHRGRR